MHRKHLPQSTPQFQSYQLIALQAEGTAKPSFSTYCLAALDHAGDKERQEDIMMNTAGIIFSAGADTVSLSSFPTI